MIEEKNHQKVYQNSDELCLYTYWMTFKIHIGDGHSTKVSMSSPYYMF